MTTVFVCPDGQGSVDPSGQYPSCSLGEGQWVDVATLFPASSGSSSWSDVRVDSAQLSELITAIALALATAYAIRLITKSLLGRR